MKTYQFLALLVSFIFILSSSLLIDNREVNTADLIDKNFKYIMKFDKTVSESELKDIESFVQTYDPTIQIIHSINAEDGTIELEIKNEGISCKSSDFGVGVILIDENNHCQCSIGDLTY